MRAPQGKLRIEINESQKPAGESNLSVRPKRDQSADQARVSNSSM
jgi:hypothetical protein